MPQLLGHSKNDGNYIEGEGKHEMLTVRNWFSSKMESDPPFHFPIPNFPSKTSLPFNGG